MDSFERENLSEFHRFPGYTEFMLDTVHYNLNGNKDGTKKTPRTKTKKFHSLYL